MSDAARQAEAGVAMIMAILIAVLVAIVVGVLTMTSLATSQGSRRDQARASSYQVATDAAQRIRQQLVAARTADTPGTPAGDGFTITTQELTDALAATADSTQSIGASAYRDVDTSFGRVALTAVGGRLGLGTGGRSLGLGA